MSDLKILTHPLLLIIVNNLLTNITAAYTRSRAVRSLAFILSTYIVYIGLSNWSQHISARSWTGRILAGTIFTAPNVLFDRLILRNWQYGKQDFRLKSLGDETQKKQRDQTRWQWGQNISGNSRYIGTDYEVANVPFFQGQDPVLGPSKWKFCLQHALIVVTFYILGMLAIDGQLNVNQKLLGDEYIPIFGRIWYGGASFSKEEITTRVKISLLSGLAASCYIQSFFSIAALLDVGLNGGEVRLWRPIFGEGKHVSTIRGFWVKFWHQCLQLNLKGPAEFVTHTILHIPRSTLIARYLKVFLTFALSGAMHIVADFGGDIPPAQSGALRFFCSQALGIMIEDTVQEIWRRMGGKKDNLFSRSVGVIWTLAFFSWSGPCWFYPFNRVMRREDMLITPGAFRPVVEGLKFW